MHGGESVSLLCVKEDDESYSLNIIDKAKQANKHEIVLRGLTGIFL